MIPYAVVALDRDQNQHPSKNCRQSNPYLVFTVSPQTSWSDHRDAVVNDVLKKKKKKRKKNTVDKEEELN